MCSTTVQINAIGIQCCYFVSSLHGAQKHLLIHFFTFILSTAVGQRKRTTWKARLYQESNCIPSGTWLRREFIGTEERFSVPPDTPPLPPLAEFPQAHPPSGRTCVKGRSSWIFCYGAFKVYVRRLKRKRSLFTESLCSFNF